MIFLSATLLALSITVHLSAQEKFIEVTVSDTVLAEAQTFVYRLSVAKDDISPYYGARNTNPAQLMEQQGKRAKCSLDSLAQLHQLVKNDARITGSVDVAVAGDESAYQKALWEKLIAKATEKAKNIAASTNHRITGVLSVTDTPEGKSAGGWTSYPPLSALGDANIPGWHTTLNPTQLEVLATTLPVNTLYPIKATFIVRFALE